MDLHTFVAIKNNMAQMIPLEFSAPVNTTAGQPIPFTHNLGAEARYVTLKIPDGRFIQPLNWTLDVADPNNKINIASIDPTVSYTGCVVYVIASVPQQTLTQILNRI